ncbi:MAG: hypothetical protein LBU30_03640, partial [Candidatus Methanoplasma sp.]|nr:hypothetical protein [Candidatus Methanoplasma sp.]
MIAFVGSLIAVSFTFENASAAADDERFDLAAALDNAEGGDVILMDSDAVLSRDATVKPGVKLDDGGFAISIETYAKLSVSGEFVSSGNLTVDFRGSVSVTSDGVMSIDNKGNAAIVTGSLEIYKDGVIRIGMHESSTLECPANGRLMVEGTMILGYGTLNSSVDVRTATVTGTLQISDGSSFRVTDSLTVGSAPTLITDMKNTASVTGKVTLADSAYVLVYGESSFGSGNIKYRAVSTQFILNGIYATEYKDNTGKR